MMKTVEEICSFLCSRGVSDIVIENIHQQKIDGDVVRLMSDNQLVEIGITTLGDRLVLKRFCQDSNPCKSFNLPTTSANPTPPPKENLRERRTFLLKCLRERYPSHRGPINDKRPRAGRPISSIRSVEFRLRIVCQDDGQGHRSSRLVRKPLGDKNMIHIKTDLNIEYEPLLAKVKEAFFPDGENPVVGEIGLFHEFEIVDSIDKNVCASLEDFTLSKYVAKKRLSGALRLNLLVAMVHVTSNEPAVTNDETQVPMRCNDNEPARDEERDPDYLPELAQSHTMESTFEATSPSGEVLYRRIVTRSAERPPQPARRDSEVTNTSMDVPYRSNRCSEAPTAASCADNTAWGRQIQYSNLLIESDSEDDEDLNKAIAASLADVPNNRNEEKTLTDLLVELASQIDRTCEPNLINVARSRLVDAACRAFAKLRFNPNSPLSIKFMDNIGQSEGAVDDGGPTQEFFTLLLHKFKDHGMFEGPDDRKIMVPYQPGTDPRLVVGCLGLHVRSTAKVIYGREKPRKKEKPAKEKDLYYFCGYTIALSMVHTSKGPHFVSPTLYDAMTKGPEAAQPTLEDVYPLDIRNMLEKIYHATSMDQLHKALDEAATFMDISGCYIPVRNLKDKDAVVTAGIKFQTLTRIREFMERFIAGLSVLGVYQKIRDNPDTFRPIWCFKPERLSAETLKTLFVQTLPEPGHNLRDSAACVLAFWNDYLQDVEEGDCLSELKDILFFATGVEYVPPLGFKTQPTLDFHSEGKFPMASTCDCVLKLPLAEIEDYNKFKGNMDEGLLNAVGFGRA